MENKSTAHIDELAGRFNLVSCFLNYFNNCKQGVMSGNSDHDKYHKEKKRPFTSTPKPLTYTLVNNSEESGIGLSCAMEKTI